MAKPPVPTIPTEDEVRELLERHQCPVPFHEVRTRFLGNIASPIMGASPMKVVQDLWGGALPEFETIEAANELIGTLVMGLWNRLTRHQERSKPFRLTRLNVPPTREGLAMLALMRRQELDGFIEGLFAQEADISVSERASHGLDTLGEMCALMVPCLTWRMTKPNRLRPARSKLPCRRARESRATRRKSRPA